MRSPSIIVAAAVAVLAGGCAGATVEPSSPVATSAATSAEISSPSPEPTSDPWAADLAQLDSTVRSLHPNPFANNPESVWVAKLDELKTTLPTSTPDEAIVGIASLVGLLDTHSGLSGPFHAYDALFYRFADGWFVTRARDASLVGSRVVSIGGHPIDEVEAALRPLVPADNESGELNGLGPAMSTVEFLHGLGIVDDPAKPGFVLERSDGSRSTVDLTSSELWQWDVNLGLTGDAPEAIARRSEPVWTRLDKPTKTFLISYNDYEDRRLPDAVTAMKTALDDGSATRVVLDMRYLRGGDGGLAQPLIEALAGDKRLDRPGALTVLIGRENVSAGTIVATAMDTQTKAVLIGEMTPARADNFLCNCADTILQNSSLTVTLPLERAGNADPRMAVEPDIPFALTAADFFAGKDPALELALSGKASQAP